MWALWQHHNYYRITGILGGGGILVVFVVERRTTKIIPMKEYRIVPECGLVYRDHENVSTNWPKIHCSRKLSPPKNTRYTVCCEYRIASSDGGNPYIFWGLLGR